MRISDWSSDVCSSDLPDLAALLGVLYLNEPHYKGPYEKNPLGRFAGWIQHKLKSNTKKTARKNIAYHYDLGNDFYKLCSTKRWRIRRPCSHASRTRRCATRNATSSAKWRSA